MAKAHLSHLDPTAGVTVQEAVQKLTVSTSGGAAMTWRQQLHAKRSSCTR